MKKLALALAATAAFAGQAIAADMPMKAARPVAAPVVVANWTGCYLAGGIGYGMYDQENVDYDNRVAPRVATTGVYDTGGRGWLGRGQVGCDYQFGGIGSMNLVIGVFGDYDWADINGRFSTGGIVATETLNSQWSVGGRIGLLVTPQLLTYFSGGYTEANFDYGRFTLNLPPPANVAANVYLNNHTYKGWFLGSGLEYALNWAPGLTVKTEYRFSEFDIGTNQFYIFGTNIRTGTEIDSKKYVQTVMTSLSYKFSFGGGAVVAKY